MQGGLSQKATSTPVESLAQQACSNTDHSLGNVIFARSSAIKRISARRRRDAGDALKTATTIRAAEKQ